VRARVCGFFGRPAYCFPSVYSRKDIVFLLLLLLIRRGGRYTSPVPLSFFFFIQRTRKRALNRIRTRFLDSGAAMESCLRDANYESAASKLREFDRTSFLKTINEVNTPKRRNTAGGRRLKDLCGSRGGGGDTG